MGEYAPTKGNFCTIPIENLMFFLFLLRYLPRNCLNKRVKSKKPNFRPLNSLSTVVAPRGSRGHQDSHLTISVPDNIRESNFLPPPLPRHTQPPFMSGKLNFFRRKIIAAKGSHWWYQIQGLFAQEKRQSFKERSTDMGGCGTVEALASAKRRR